MRTAIVHDWFQGYHGAERTAEAMLDLFAADPDILTFQAARDVLPPRLATAIVRESRLARLPGSASGATTRAAGAGCCRTCPTTSSTST